MALLAIAREQAKTNPTKANAQLETARDLFTDIHFINKDLQLYNLATEQAKASNKHLYFD